MHSNHHLLLSTVCSRTCQPQRGSTVMYHATSPPADEINADYSPRTCLMTLINGVRAATSSGAPAQGCEPATLHGVKDIGPTRPPAPLTSRVLGPTSQAFRANTKHRVDRVCSSTLVRTAPFVLYPSACLLPLSLFRARPANKAELSSPPSSVPKLMCRSLP